MNGKTSGKAAKLVSASKNKMAGKGNFQNFKSSSGMKSGVKAPMSMDTIKGTDKGGV